MQNLNTNDSSQDQQAFNSPTQKRSRTSSDNIPRMTGWGTPIVPPSQSRHSLDLEIDFPKDQFDDIDLSANCGASDTTDGGSRWNTLENIAALGLSFGADGYIHETFNATATSPGKTPNSAVPRASPIDQKKPFHKWVKTLQKRAHARRQTISDIDTSKVAAAPAVSPHQGQSHSRHKKSSSGSSMAFVTAVKSASISLVSFGATRSKRTAMSSGHFRADRSSRGSNTGHRNSEGDLEAAKGVIYDELVTERSLRRRQIIEEIINTEENYVADIRFLMNVRYLQMGALQFVSHADLLTKVYVTLLASIPTLSLSLRSSISRNLTEIVELHEEILGDLHHVVPHSEYSQADYPKQAPVPIRTKRHQRWRSLDAVPENTGDLAWLQTVPGMTTEPEVAARVARVFGQKMYRFFAYEEYGAKYESMVKDVASTYRTIPQWDVYQKGLEALAAALASINRQQGNTKKALTVGDLLVKPIQRVCRYPLLFAELLRQTPVCDSPDSHMEIEKVLIRFRETTGEINRATEDPRMKAIMEKTWLLQDKLCLSGQADSHSGSLIRSLGHVHLCGVLHCAWQTKIGVKGQYMICLLYRECLLLASPEKNGHIYKVYASIGLCEIRVEDTDNSRGIQCHTAPYSWKLVFEYDHQLFEIILSACSPKEELEWRSRLSERASKEPFESCDQALVHSLLLDVKPLGTVFGKPGTIARRLSIHRATTLGPKSNLCQVIIKNTSTLKESSQSPNVSSSTIIRSQSLLTTNRIPILAPTRLERVKLEAVLADVWTRDILPFPGMTGRARSEHLVRTGASSMMRKLSAASIASSFTRRSSSLASLRRTTDGEDTAADESIASFFARPGLDQLVPGDGGCCSSSVAESREDGSSEGRVGPALHGSRSASTLGLPASGPVAGAGVESDGRKTETTTTSIKKLTALKLKRSWTLQYGGSGACRGGGPPARTARPVTPPLRTSSANSARGRMMMLRPGSEAVGMKGLRNESAVSVGARSVETTTIAGVVGGSELRGGEENGEMGDHREGVGRREQPQPGWGEKPSREGRCGGGDGGGGGVGIGGLGFGALELTSRFSSEGIRNFFR